MNRNKEEKEEDERRRSVRFYLSSNLLDPTRLLLLTGRASYPFRSAAVPAASAARSDRGGRSSDSLPESHDGASSSCGKRVVGVRASLGRKEQKEVLHDLDHFLFSHCAGR